MIEKLSVMDNSIRLVITIAISFLFFVLMVIFKDSFGLIFGIPMLLTIMLNPYLSSLKNQKIIDTISNNNVDYVNKNIPRYDDYLFSSDDSNAIVIDQLNEKLYILTRSNLRSNLNSEYKKEEFDFSQIIESAIIEDENMLTKTSKTGLIGGSLLGGVIAGGVGSIVGALASNKTSIKQVRNLKLNIVVDDIMNPIYSISLLNSDNPIGKDEMVYTKLLEVGNLWHKRMSVIINRNEK